jgi:hypothetical protein
MADDPHPRLDQIDLSSITLQDLRKLKNPALKNALTDLVRMPDDLMAIGHQNHSSHGDHATAPAAEFRKMTFRPEEARGED